MKIWLCSNYLFYSGAIMVSKNFKFFLLPRLVNETHAIALVQAGMRANQFASVIDHAGNITNFTENRTGKSFFFSPDSKETCSLILVSVIRKVKS